MSSTCLAALGRGGGREVEAWDESRSQIGHELGTVAAGQGGLIIASLHPCVFEVSCQEKLESSTGDFTQHLCGSGSSVHAGDSLPLLSPLT